MTNPLYYSSGEAATFITLGNQLFEELWQSVRDERYFVFKAAACREAHILLTSFIRNTKTRNYQIIIGAVNNQQTWIGRDRLTGSDVVKASTPDILSCTLTQYFWISWNNKVIAVGRGSVPGERGIANYKDSNNEPYEIRAVSVGTENNVRGSWEFNTYEGQFCRPERISKIYDLKSSSFLNLPLNFFFLGLQQVKYLK